MSLNVPDHNQNIPQKLAHRTWGKRKRKHTQLPLRPSLSLQHPAAKSKEKNSCRVTESAKTHQILWANNCPKRRPSRMACMFPSGFVRDPLHWQHPRAQNPTGDSISLEDLLTKQNCSPATVFSNGSIKTQHQLSRPLDSNKTSTELNQINWCREIPFCGQAQQKVSGLKKNTLPILPRLTQTFLKGNIKTQHALLSRSLDSNESSA